MFSQWSNGKCCLYWRPRHSLARSGPEFVITTIIAGVFILSADRIPLLRRHVIPGSLLYGFGVFIVMNFIVLPLSAAPPLPAPPMWLLIEIILEHVLLIGLPLGLLVRWNDSANQ
jgi:hypothetical protein